MATRKLVITADDFGYCPEVDQAIIDLFRDTLITATTVIAVSPHLSLHSSDLLPFSSHVGLHAVLSSDRGNTTWKPSSQEMRHVMPVFPDDPAQISPATREQIKPELETQLQALKDTGFSPNRLDSHSGTLYGLRGPSFMGEALQLCADHNLGFRLPRSLTMFVGDHVPEPLVSSHSQAITFADQLHVALPQEIVSNQQAIADIPSYESLRDSYLRMLDQFPEGTSELFLHPAYDSDIAREKFGSAWQKRVWELQLLRDPLWQKALDRSDIELVAAW